MSIQRGLPVHQIFLDLTQAYDTLDWARTLEILQQYGMGPNLLRVLCSFWGNLKVVPCQSDFYGTPIPLERGVTQGDPLSPTQFEPLKIIFYADDGLLAGIDSLMKQDALSTITILFSRVGLQMNANKTKTLLGQPTDLHQRQQKIVECPKCPKTMQQANLQNHLLTMHNDYQRPQKEEDYYKSSKLDQRPIKLVCLQKQE